MWFGNEFKKDEKLREGTKVQYDLETFHVCEDTLYYTMPTIQAR